MPGTHEPSPPCSWDLCPSFPPLPLSRALPLCPAQGLPPTASWARPREGTTLGKATQPSGTAECPPRGAAGRVHSGRGPEGAWLKWHQETGPGGVAPRLWRALRGEMREPQAQLRQESATETGVPGGALSDSSHCASRASALFSDKRGDGARQGLLPPALLPSPAVFKKTHAFPPDLEIGAIRYGLSLSFSLS